MKNIALIKTTTSLILVMLFIQNLNAQCQYVPATSGNTDSLTYTFSGGIFASYGCTAIDPNYWLTGNGNSVTVTFVSPQSYPTFRVWGMNDDDSVTVAVNGLAYPLNNSTASYDAKVVCGQSPGPDGIIFSAGKIVGANSNELGNYSYQNVQLITANVNSFTVTGINGAGWGFAGASINCPLITGTTEMMDESNVAVYPNPISNKLTFEINNKEQTIVTLYDFYGKQIMQQKFYHKTTINTEEFPSGIYFYELRNDNALIGTGKILKE